MSVSVLSKVGFSGRRENRDPLMVAANAAATQVFPKIYRGSYAWIVAMYRRFVPLEKDPQNFWDACRMVARHSGCACQGQCAHCRRRAYDIWPE